MKTVRIAVLAAVAALTGAAYADTIRCGETGVEHLQGVTCDGTHIYWSFTTKIVKTDLTGAVVTSADVPGHSGDLCVHLGKLYVATDEGKYVRASNFKQEVRVYDTATLKLLKVYNLDADFVPRGFEISCIEYANGRFWIPAGFDENVVDEKNYVMEYTPSFELVAVHELPTGSTQYGIQTIAYHDRYFYMGNYAGTTGVKAGMFACPPGLKTALPLDTHAWEGVMSVTGVLYMAVSTKSGGVYTSTATSVDRLDELFYHVDAAPGGLTDTPDTLLAYGFLPKSRYCGGTNMTFTAAGTEQNNLIANPTPLRGKVVTLAPGAEYAYAGGIAVGSGTLEVPSATAIEAPPSQLLGTLPYAPIVLSAGTLRFNGGGTLSRDIVLHPSFAYTNYASVIEVAADAAVTNTGRFLRPELCGNFVKRGAGTFVLATPKGDDGVVVTNLVGSAGCHPSQWKNVVPLNENGDGPLGAVAACNILDGRFVIATDPSVVTVLGHQMFIGGPTTRTGVETAGHLDIYSGIVRCEGFVTLGRDNGTEITAPDGLSSTMNLYGGSFSCNDFDMSYNSYHESGVRFTCRPVLNIHGGAMTVKDHFRMDYPEGHATVNIDGGSLTVGHLDNSYYYTNCHMTVNISNGGSLTCKSVFRPANYSSAATPTYMRVNVTDGGLFALKTMSAHATSTGQDTRFYFNGGTLKSLQSAYTDEISPYMPIDVGEKGMTLDLTSGTHWGLQIKSRIAAASGVTDGGMRIVNTSTPGRWVVLSGGVDLAGGITAEDPCWVLFGSNVNTSVTCMSPGMFLGCTADATVDEISTTGDNNFVIGMSGAANVAGVRAYLLTVNAFTSPAGVFTVWAYNAGTTSYSEPFGTFPFLRVPASSPLTAANFVFRSANSDGHIHRFIDSVADGWRTISWVHEATDTRETIDPRASDDWLVGSGKAFTIGPWLLDYDGNGVTANFMYSSRDDKTNEQAGGIDVADSLTLTGGGYVYSAPFVKRGEGTLTLAGNACYSFGTSFNAVFPADDPAVWNLFDINGNAVTGHEAGVIIDAGKLVLGTGSDSPLLKYPSGNELWVGSVTTTETGAEKDATFEVNSGTLQMNGLMVVGRNRGSSETASHEPLKSSYVQNGGDVKVGSLIVGHKSGTSVEQEDTFTLNGGHFAADTYVRLGEGAVTGTGTNIAKLVINGGYFEAGKGRSGTSTDGWLIASHSSTSNRFNIFEMNGGEAMLWCDFVCGDSDSDFRTQVRLNGGTITYGGNKSDIPRFGGNAASELHWNGTVLKPYWPKHRESIVGQFKNFAVREIGPNGAIVDLSDANIEIYEFTGYDIANDFTGSGPIIARGGNTNKAVRIAYTLSATSDFIAEKGGVIEVWHDNYSYFGATRTVRVKDGGGVATYYSRPIKEVYLGETAADSTFLYAYGYAGNSPFVVSSKLEVKGTVYCAFRAAGLGCNPLRMPSGTRDILQGPKGCFDDVDVATQFKLHPLLQREGLTATFSLNKTTNYDAVRITCSANTFYGNTSPVYQPPYPQEVDFNSARKINGTVTLGWSMEGQFRPWQTSGGGTVRIVEPLSGNGVLRLTTGRVEGPPSYFDGITLDLNNASVRFTESGTTSVNIQNLNSATNGIGLEAVEGAVVHVTGTLTNRSALLKMDPGTIILHGSTNDFTLAAGAWKSGVEGGTWSDSTPRNGDIPTTPAIGINAGTLAFDMPGLTVVDAGASNAYIYVGAHPIPDGKGGAYPAVFELWQGELRQISTYSLCIGRYMSQNAGGFDDFSKFTKRPYVGVNVRGGTLRAPGLIMGYSNYGVYNTCALFELNIFDGLVDIGDKRIAVNHDGSNLKIGDEEKECVINIYGGELRKAAGEPFAVGAYYGAASQTYPARGTINMYGGKIVTDPSMTINVPHQSKGIGKVNMHGGVIETKNFLRNNSSSGAEGYLLFDGGTFRPLQNGARLSGFTAVTVGAGGGTIDMTNANVYAVAQLAPDPSLNGEKDGGFGASGTGTLIMEVANGFTGPTHVSGTATLKQGVADAFSEDLVLDGGTVDLNGIATTFRSVRGHGTIVGDVTVTGEFAPEGTLNVTGNLTLANGATFLTAVDDDGIALNWLNVTGALTAGSGVTLDLDRYDDRAIVADKDIQLGQVGSGSSFRPTVKHITMGRGWLASVSIRAGGIILLDVHPRGTLLHFR